MDISAREAFPQNIDGFSGFFQLFRKIGNLKSLPGALIMYVLEDASFYNDFNNKPNIVKEMFEKTSKFKDYAAQLKFTLNVLNTIYANDDYNMLDELISNEDARVYFNNIFLASASFPKLELSEELTLRICAKMISATIYFYNFSTHAKSIFSVNDSKIKIYLVVNEGIYSILYPIHNYYHTFSEIFFKDARVNLVDPCISNFTNNRNIENAKKLLVTGPRNQIPSLRNSLKIGNPDPLGNRNDDKNLNSSISSSMKNEEQAKKHKINSNPNKGKKDKKREEKCLKCNQFEVLYFLSGCRCKICTICLEDQFFRISKYQCPSCGQLIQNRIRLDILKFIECCKIDQSENCKSTINIEFN